MLRTISWEFYKIMEEEIEAILQRRDGWTGMRDLLSNWLIYATSRESRSMLRIHRSPQLRNSLQDFLSQQRVRFFQ